MVRVLLLKLNGWPQWFDERVESIGKNVDEVILVRPKPSQGVGNISGMDNVQTYNLRPERGRFVRPVWLQPVVFTVHVFQAILLMLLLYLRGSLPPVIHALDYALGGTAGSVIKRLFGVPLVVSVRGIKDYRFEQIPASQRTIRNEVGYAVLRGLTRFVFSSADHIITKSAYQVEFVTDTCDADAGFTTVPTGVDFDLFDPDRESVQPTLTKEVERELKEKEDVVVFLSTLIPKKGPDQVLRLLNATEDIPENTRFAFVGEFREEEFEKMFRTLLRDVGDRAVLRPEPVPFESVPDILARADATILLSEAQTEGTPRILQESCAMQTPIIASDVDGIRGAFGKLPGCHLIDREEPTEFRQAVESATDDTVEMPRENFAERFEIDRNYAKYADIYQTLDDMN